MIYGYELTIYLYPIVSHILNVHSLDTQMMVVPAELYNNSTLKEYATEYLPKMPPNFR